MERKEFIKKIAVGTAIVTTGSVLLASCRKTDPAPENFDFNIDLLDPTVSALLGPIGGSMHKNDLLIIHESTNSYIALSSICTHRKCRVEYFKSQNNIECPCHSSTFNIAGDATNGPAKIPLKKFKTELNGNLLRVTDQK